VRNIQLYTLSGKVVALAALDVDLGITYSVTDMFTAV